MLDTDLHGDDPPFMPDGPAHADGGTPETVALDAYSRVVTGVVDAAARAVVVIGVSVASTMRDAPCPAGANPGSCSRPMA